MTDKYEQIDKVLDDWLPKYGLAVYKMHRDEPTRVISVIDNSGDKYDLWLTPDTDNRIQVAAHETSRGKHGQRWRAIADIDDLADTLNKAYKAIDQWINDKGHERTWY